MTFKWIANSMGDAHAFPVSCQIERQTPFCTYARTDPFPLLFGCIAEHGVSIEWHDFQVARELDWSRSFHPGCLEICLNSVGITAVRLAEREGFGSGGGSPQAASRARKLGWTNAGSARLRGGLGHAREFPVSCPNREANAFLRICTDRPFPSWLTLARRDAATLNGNAAVRCGVSRRRPD